MCFSPRLDPLQVFGHGGPGSVDAGPENFFHGPMLRGVRSVGPWTDRLGEKFENIYPIMIGSVASCEGLAAVLGDRCSLIRISGQAPSAIVSIPPEKVEEIRQSPTVKEWVVIRNISEMDGPPARLDEIYRRSMEISWEAPFVKR